MRDVIVIGGGPGGLTAAWKLKQRGLDILVVEGKETVGGNVRTIEHNGFRLECGPHSFMGSSEYIWKLTHELGLQDDAELSSPAAKDRYIFRDGRLVPLPNGLFRFIRTPLLSARAKLRLMAEPFIPNGAEPFETAWEFFCRRFGQESATYIMSPFVSGIYAGDVKKLGARASFSKFWSFEKDAGSMILGALKFSLAKKRRLKREGAEIRKGIFSFKGGLGAITSKLAEKLDDEIILNMPVRTIEKEAKEFIVKAQGSQWKARSVILATPPGVSSVILAGLLPDVVEPLNSIPMAPVALAHWSQPDGDFPPGFGFLMPRLYDLRVLGTLFPSQLFSGRAPQGQQVFASFYGGMTDPDAAGLGDDELSALLIREHETIFGFKLQKPNMMKILRYSNAIPQLLPDHPEKISDILEKTKRAPGIFLAGNYLTGVGVEHAVTSGYNAAEESFEYIKAG